MQSCFFIFLVAVIASGSWRLLSRSRSAFQGHSMSLEPTHSIGWLYDFLLVFHSNYGHRWYRYRGKRRFPSKIATFPGFYLTPCDGSPLFVCFFLWRLFTPNSSTDWFNMMSRTGECMHWCVVFHDIVNTVDQTNITSLMTKTVVVAEPRNRKNHSWRPEHLM